MAVVTGPLTPNEVRRIGGEVLRFADAQRYIRECMRRARGELERGTAQLRTYDALQELAAQFGGPLEQQVLDLATEVLETAPGVADAFDRRAEHKASVDHCGPIPVG